MIKFDAMLLWKQYMPKKHVRWGIKIWCLCDSLNRYCLVGMHRYHFFTNRYEYEYFYLCTCRYRVPIPILLRFGLHESAINLEADFILSSADYVKPMVQN